MNASRQERDLLNRYLLGYLAEEDRDSITLRFFQDEQLAEALEDAERDLLDAYARGDLNTKDNAAVEARLLNSERQREKLAVARALAYRSAARKGPTATYRLWLLAAALVLILGAAGAVWQSRHIAPQSSVKVQPASPPVKERPAPAKAIPVFAALLTPGGLRDGEVQAVTLPAQAETVRLDLQLDTWDANATYAVHLVRQREAVFEQSGIVAHRESDIPILSLALKSAVLKAGQYRLSVSAAGRPAETLTYRFQIR